MFEICFQHSLFRCFFYQTGLTGELERKTAYGVGKKKNNTHTHREFETFMLFQSRKTSIPVNQKEALKPLLGVPHYLLIFICLKFAANLIPSLLLSNFI